MAEVLMSEQEAIDMIVELPATRELKRLGSMAGGISSTHVRHHVKKQKFSATCPICAVVGREAIEGPQVGAVDLA